MNPILILGTGALIYALFKKKEQPKEKAKEKLTVIFKPDSSTKAQAPKIAPEVQEAKTEATQPKQAIAQPPASKTPEQLMIESKTPEVKALESELLHPRTEDVQRIEQENYNKILKEMNRQLKALDAKIQEDLEKRGIALSVNPLSKQRRKLSYQIRDFMKARRGTLYKQGVTQAEVNLLTSTRG